MEARRCIPASCEKWRRGFFCDLRAADSKGVRDEFFRLHAAIGEERRLIVAASRGAGPALQIHSRLAGSVTGLILWDCESVADIVRAELNDQSHCAAMSLALTILLARMPARTHPILREVLGSGLRNCYVKQVAATAGNDRGTPNRQAKIGAGFTATMVARLARACAAGVMLRSSSLPLVRVAQLSGYDRLDSLHNLLMGAFNQNARQIRGSGGDADPAVWLTEKLDTIFGAMEGA